MKIFVDADRCRGHGVCLSACPDAFTLNEYGYAEVTVPEVAAEYAAGVAEAGEGICVPNARSKSWTTGCRRP
ncbi:ferredoxin [Nocardia brevicatena]|uniref:ferredoxin n=1 Tax=Nocardia brevicatena TaxID=37327 RepID=UPI00030BFAC0|nr:ferredoxin [Nocardia brevicatena]